MSANKTAEGLEIKAEQIAAAKGMIADGFGRDAVAEELNLHKHYRTCEYGEVLNALNIKW
jgi:hypothetical protein